MNTLTREAILQAVIESVLSVAPEVDFKEVRADRPLREQLDLDSFDFLNVLLAIHKQLGVDIPEVDYPRITTLNAMVDYLAEKSRS
jgi:acyl carrier protein